MSTRVERADVCIVGAGIAGLNALFVASQYLSRDQKIIVVDRRERTGGMWVDTYDYVRLHQPHGLFTAGNIEWTLGQDPSYLATKGEALDHFETLPQRDQAASAGRGVLRVDAGVPR
jgi:cation diffusion facilitator CzcD-associated flavoprotein CzcO